MYDYLDLRQSERLKELVPYKVLAPDADEIIKELDRLNNIINELEKKAEQLENIRKEAITYILENCEIIRHEKENVDEVGNVNGADLLNILNKGDNKE